jgi:signal transduction histidine kinase
MADDPWFVSLLMASIEDPPGELAFRLWARSPLSRLPLGCDLAIRDRAGERNLSRFEIDMPPAALLPEPPTGTSLESPASWWAWVDLGDRSTRYLIAQAPVFSPAGEFLAQLILRMASESDAQRPEILRPYEPDSLGSDPRVLFYAEYDGDRLTQTSNPDYPGLHRASPEVTRAIIEERQPLVWFRETIGGGTWINLYRPRMLGDRVTGMMSVGFKSRDERGLLLSFFQFLLVNAIVALVFGAVRLLVPPRKLEIKFQHKLLLSYLIVSAVPVMLLAEVNRTFARESVEQQMQATLRQGVRVVKGELARREIIARLAATAGTGPPREQIRSFVSDEDMKEIGSRLGLEVNLFLTGAGGHWGAPLVASSEPGLFATELFSDRLPGRAWLETILLGQEFFAKAETAGGYSYLVGYSPIRDASGQAIGAIGLPLIFGQDAVDRELARRNSLILALYLLILLVVIFIGMVLARRISSPIEELATATRRLSAGDLDYRIPRRSRDEFGYLVDSFNQMTADLRASREQLVAAERDAAWREMAKQIAHEIKNPLTPMRLSAQHILRAFRDRHEMFEEVLTRGVDTIIRQTESLTRIAGEFSAFARLPITERRPTDVAALAREVAGLYAGLPTVTVKEQIGETPPINADPEELRRVLVNLATNAVQAMEPHGGTLTIRTGVIRARYSGAHRELVEISFADTGTGIRKEDLERLFRPNFSTKTGGTGLGLAMCKAVVEGLGGHIGVESEVGVGSVFVVRIPVGQGEEVKQ